MQGHIDKISKKIDFDITRKPIGATQWDFICSIPEAEESLLRNYNKGPETLFIYPTTRCSQSCEKCSLKEKNPMDIDITLIKELINIQKSIALKYVVLDGDVFMSRNIPELLDFLADNKIQCSVNSYSKINEGNLLYLKNKVSKIQFHMTSITENEYNYDIRNTLELCKKHDIYVAIIFSIDSDNYNQIEDMIDFCKEFNVKQFSFMRLNFCPFDQTNTKFMDSENYLSLSQKLVDLRRNEKSVHITSNDAIWKGCGACAISCTITADGEVHPCAFLPLRAGNIYQDNLTDIWKSKIFHELRTSQLAGKCGNCKYKFHCKGCRAVAYLQTGNYLASDRGCWIE